MSNITTLDDKLNQMILGGKGLEAFEEFYAENVVMQENSEPPRIGKAANRAAEQEFYGSVEAWHHGKVVASAVNGDVSFSEWDMAVTLKGMGRIQMAQVAVRRWAQGKVVHERFYYQK